MKHQLRSSLLGIGGAALLAACNSGGVSVDVSGPSIGPISGISEPVVSIGAAVINGEIQVNGVDYSTHSATVRMNGVIVASTAVLDGHIVHVDGRVRGLGLEGSAETIDIESNIIGPVTRIDPVRNRITVLRQAVTLGDGTHFGPGIGPGGIADIPLGSVLRVSGYATADGRLAATRVDSVASLEANQVIGRVSFLDSARMRFRIGDLQVDYSNARLVALALGEPQDGEYLLVRGVLFGDGLRADVLESVRGSTGRSVGERTYLEGLITRIADGGAFEVGAFRVALRSVTQFDGGSRDDLDPDAQIRIYGRTGADGVTIDADRIEYLRFLDERP